MKITTGNLVRHHSPAGGDSGSSGASDLRVSGDQIRPKTERLPEFPALVRHESPRLTGKLDGRECTGVPLYWPIDAETIFVNANHAELGPGRISVPDSLAGDEALPGLVPRLSRC